MELLPTSLAVSAVFRGGPFTLAHNRERRAVDDELDRPLGGGGGTRPRGADCAERAWCGRGLRDRCPAKTGPTASSPPLGAMATGKRAGASRRLAGRVLARTQANFRHDISSCTWDKPSTSCRERAPAAVKIAREPTVAYDTLADGPCTNAGFACRWRAGCGSSRGASRTLLASRSVQRNACGTAISCGTCSS